MAHIPAVLLPKERDNFGGGGAEGEVSHKELVGGSSGFWGGGWWRERQSHLSRGCETIGALQMGGGEKGAGK